ncbi:hypothetical protein CN947_06745 [Bacillus cereus]|nr:hypothetical protein CN947_06745 [Bacillus cereus]
MLLNCTIINEIISAIFRIYRPQLEIYQRFLKFIDCNLKYISDSTRDIDLPKKYNKYNGLIC